ncbi:MAG: PAS domain-containing sensor histidine kinase [Gelidibacter sp.]
MKIEQLSQDVIQDPHVGHWEINDNQISWSAAFLDIIGCSVEDVHIDLNYFLYTVLEKGQRDIFRNYYFSLLSDGEDFEQTLTLRCKNGELKEFRCKSGIKSPVKKGHSSSKVISFIPVKIKTNDQVKDDNFYYRETAEMNSTGSWYLDFINKRTYWDQEARRIFEYPIDYVPSLKYGSTYIAKDQLDLANRLYDQCAINGKSFTTEIKMLTAHQREFWIKVIGKPVYNDHREIVGIRGIFQDIDDIKLKELSLQKTAEIISSQNKRLFNFAHIVSHNLRSHTSNLSLIMDLMDETTDETEKMELIASIKDVSESLNSTIEHLNDVVTIQTQTDQNMVNVNFQDTLDLVLKSIISFIVKHDVTIHSDFEQIKSVNYIPAYLESILLNLITNGIKYSQEGRTAIIAIRSYLEDNKTILEISDNGMGIDLEKYGKNLFGMYKTFHHNKDAVGIGLFITKNQIESLNGEIFVESIVGQGTTFKIQF